MVNQGDILIISFDPQSGHEQKGRRPSIVVSNNKFQKYFPINAIVCPITNTNRNWETHFRLPDSLKTKGFVMCEQLKFVDLKARDYRYIEQVPDEFFEKVLEIIKILF